MAMLRWTVEILVDESWVADGYDLNDERAKEMLNHDLSGAYGHEIGARVIDYPSAIRVAKLQGYTGKQLAEGTKIVLKKREEGKLWRGRR